MVKGVDFLQVEQVAVAVKAQLKKGDRLVAEQAFTVHAEHRWRETAQYLLTNFYDRVPVLNERVLQRLPG